MVAIKFIKKIIAKFLLLINIVTRHISALRSNTIQGANLKSFTFCALKFLPSVLSVDSINGNIMNEDKTKPSPNKVTHRDLILIFLSLPVSLIIWGFHYFISSFTNSNGKYFI